MVEDDAQNTIILNIVEDKKDDAQDTITNFKSHYCYLLQSISNSRKTYFGYTVNPKRRLRQHNGEIVGGAKRTRRARPWKMMLFISGFIDNHQALSFEWHLHHPPRRGSNLKGRLRIITEVAKMNKWKNTYLTVNIIEPSIELPSCPKNLNVNYI